MYNLTIHALGGCHLNGYPFNREDSFIELATLGLDSVRLIVHAPCSIRKIINILRDCTNDFGDSVVLLQIGNYESLTSLANTTGSRLAYSESKSGRSLMPRINALKRARYFKESLKMLLLFYRELIRKPIFDAERFTVELREVCRLLHNSATRRVIVLSAFITASPADNVYRRRLNKIMKQLTEQAGFDFLDVYQVLANAKKKNNLSVMADAIHLNRRGHEILAHLVRERLSL